MKWCVHFPNEEILIKRPCLKQACVGNKNAATLLSFLLYHVSINDDFRGSPESSQDHHQATSITLHFTQRDMITRLDSEMSDRTLRETAIPLLVALDYVAVDESQKANAYTVNLAKIQAGIDHAPAHPDVLHKLQDLIEDGKTSAIFRKYFRRLITLLQTHGGKTSDTYPQQFRHHAEELPLSRGKTSATHIPDRSAWHQYQELSLSEDKNTKRNKENEMKEVAMREAETVQKKQMKSAAALSPKKNDSDDAHPHEDHAHHDQQAQGATIHASPEAEALVCLIENLRGQPFPPPARKHQMRAATLLMRLQPTFSLQDIQAAWIHGSDIYWRTHYDPSGMTLTDLAHHNSHGKRRIFAILEHQQRQQTTYGQRSQSESALVSPEQRLAPVETHSEKRVTMPEQEAIQLVAEIRQVAQSYACALDADRVYEHETWSVKVNFERHIFTVSDRTEWERRQAVIQNIMSVRQKIAAGKRAG